MKKLKYFAALSLLPISEQSIAGLMVHAFPAIDIASVPVDSPWALAGLATAVFAVAYRILGRRGDK